MGLLFGIAHQLPMVGHPYNLFFMNPSLILKSSMLSPSTTSTNTLNTSSNLRQKIEPMRSNKDDLYNHDNLLLMSIFLKEMVRLFPTVICESFDLHFHK